MPNGSELDDLVAQYNSLMGAGLGMGRKFKGREDEAAAGEFSDMLDTLTDSLDELRGGRDEPAEETADEEVAEDEQPRLGALGGFGLGALAGLAGKLGGGGGARAVGQIPGRRMVVMSEGQDALQGIASTLAGIAAVGMLAKGAVLTKAAGSKL